MGEINQVCAWKDGQIQYIPGSEEGGHTQRNQTHELHMGDEDEIKQSVPNKTCYLWIPTKGSRTVSGWQQIGTSYKQHVNQDHINADYIGKMVHQDCWCQRCIPS